MQLLTFHEFECEFWRLISKRDDSWELEMFFEIFDVNEKDFLRERFDQDQQPWEPVWEIEEAMIQD